MAALVGPYVQPTTLQALVDFCFLPPAPFRFEKWRKKKASEQTLAGRTSEIWLMDKTPS
jgi:hypothetical protein